MTMQTAISIASLPSERGPAAQLGCGQQQDSQAHPWHEACGYLMYSGFRWYIEVSYLRGPAGELFTQSIEVGACTLTFGSTEIPVLESAVPTWVIERFILTGA